MQLYMTQLRHKTGPGNSIALACISFLRRVNMHLRISYVPECEKSIKIFICVYYIIVSFMCVVMDYVIHNKEQNKKHIYLLPFAFKP